MNNIQPSFAPAQGPSAAASYANLQTYITRADSTPPLASFPGTLSDLSSVASSLGPATPSPTLPSVRPSATAFTPHHLLPAMSQGDMYYPHITTGQPQPQSHSGMAHYQSAQPPLLHPQAQYPPPPQYAQPYYGGGMSHPGTVPNQILPPPVAVPSHGPLGAHPGTMQSHYPTSMDTTGQVAPPGMKPRVTATLWEDEGSLCFQVEARGICVARREDNHMINGTKLLNVAGMTRGRRDGILKSEKIRHVVKIGPMHLKGVWIPFERALDFANKEKITELLYPLFVHNISSLLCHPANQNRANPVMAAHERRKQEANLMTSNLPSLHHQQMALPGPSQPLASNGHHMARPTLERAHTFPTPPATAGGVMGGMGPQEGFQWSQQQQGTHPLPMDSFDHNRSIPSPATTPPGGAIAPMQTYSQPPANVSPYDTRPSMYNTHSGTQSPYTSTAPMSQDRNVYTSSYVKTDMSANDGRNGPTSASVMDPHDKAIMPNDTAAHIVPTQSDNTESHHHQTSHQHQHQHQHQPAEADQDGEYTHDSTYDHQRAPQYNYPAPPVSALPETHMPAETVQSPGIHPASGRATPRTSAPQNFYQESNSYPGSPRVVDNTSASMAAATGVVTPSATINNNVFSAMGGDRTVSGSGTPAPDYSTMDPIKSIPVVAPVLSSNTSAPVRASTNNLKRSLEDDDERVDSKRRKTDGSALDETAPYDTSARRIATPRRR